MCVCVYVQVYRSVLLRQAPGEQVSDENMEVDLASGGECKLTPSKWFLFIFIFNFTLVTTTFYHTSNFTGVVEEQIIFCQP